METNQSDYDQLKVELEDCQQSLWDLLDEYKTNVSAAEKLADEESEKREKLEKELQELQEKFSLQGSENLTVSNTEDININLLGLPACVLDNEGKLIEFNNKFKFFVELLLLEIEDIPNLLRFSEQIENKDLAKKLLQYFQSDKNVFQDIFSAVNSFKKRVYVVLRIYRNELTNKHLALWIELQKEELSVFQLPVSEKEKKPQTTLDETIISNENQLIIDIQSYVKRYEISAQLLSFINKKINKKAENITLIREIYNKIEKTFNLKKEAESLLKRIETKDKTFINKIKEQFPELTANEQKHCLLIRQGLTYKEIAALMEISVNGVKIARNRLRKKLQLDGETKTSEFIMRI
ncbi:MAG: hypothetical protein L3J74_03985 [Bacteroidales bacterium]|nr:hypothetical protein [Bacteroidales bacterium]